MVDGRFLENFSLLFVTFFKTEGSETLVSDLTQVVTKKIQNESCPQWTLLKIATGCHLVIFSY